VSHPSARRRQRTLTEAHAALAAVRRRVTRLRCRTAAVRAERDALVDELRAAEAELAAAAAAAVTP